MPTSLTHFCTSVVQVPDACAFLPCLQGFFLSFSLPAYHDLAITTGIDFASPYVRNLRHLITDYLVSSLPSLSPKSTRLDLPASSQVQAHSFKARNAPIEHDNGRPDPATGIRSQLPRTKKQYSKSRSSYTASLQTPHVVGSRHESRESEGYDATDKPEWQPEVRP